MYVWKKYLDTHFYDRELKAISMHAKAVPYIFLTANSNLCGPINIIRIDILEMRIYLYLCSTVRPRDTRPQAARTLTMHVFELGPKNFEIHVF